MTYKTAEEVWLANKDQFKASFNPTTLFDAGLVTGLLILNTWIRNNEKKTAQTQRIAIEINQMIYDITGTIKRIEDLCQQHSQSSEISSETQNSDTHQQAKQSATSPSHQLVEPKTPPQKNGKTKKQSS